VDSALGGRLPSGDDLPRLPFASMVLAEALRLHPPLWFLSRRATEDYEVGGYVVPAGSIVVMSQYVTHHDPRFFPDPFRFDPDRWTEEARSARPDFSYFPFGGGKRRCIGEGFAWAEGALILAAFAQWWRFSPASTQPVGMLPGLVLRPDANLRLRVERRGVNGRAPL
jgi:cytochrome P450